MHKPFFALMAWSLFLPAAALAQDKSGSRSGLMKLPEAGGTVTAESGTFSIASNKGASQYTLPFPDLPTRAGIAPQLALNYSQFAGDSGQGFGIGWSLSVPSIEASTELGVPLAGVLPTGELRNYLTFQGQKLVFIRTEGGKPLYRLKANEEDIRLVYHTRPYTLAHASPVDGLTPSISSGFEVVHPDGRRQLYSGDLSVAEGTAKIVTRYVLTFDVAPNGESIAYFYTKDAGRSYLTDVSFAGGSSRYHLELIDGLGHLRSYAMGFPQENRKLYAKVTASFQGDAQAQWCLAYIGRKADARNSFAVKAHADCQDKAQADLETRIDANSLDVLDELRTIYRYGADGILSAETLRLPSMHFGYTSWTQDHLVERQLVYPIPSLVDGAQFSVRNYELADINHDGLVDAIRKNSNGNSDIFQSTGDMKSLFQNPKFWTVQRGGLAVAPDLSSNQFHFADLNGDSYVDLLQFDGADAYIYLGESSGGFKWTEQTLRLTSDGSINAQTFDQGQAQFIDINNDGKSDILTTGLDSNGKTTWKVYLNLATPNGPRWDFKFTPKTFAFPFPDSSLRLSDSNFRITDVNGDQLPDVIYLSSSLEADQSGLCVYLNQGRLYDLNAQDLLFGDASSGAARCGRGGQFTRLNGLHGLDSLLGLWLVDVNGDGILDIATMGASNQELLVWLGFGDLQISEQPLHLPLNLPVRISSTLDASRSRVADIDGDGQAEILIFDESASGESRALMIDFNRETEQQLIKANLLTSVDFESGLRYDIRYATSTTERIRDLRLGRETSPLHFPLVVAKQLVSSQGIPGLTRQSVQVQEFFYHKPYYDPDDKEFLGFTDVESLNYGDSYADDSAFVEESYYTDAPDAATQKLAGKLKSRRIYRLENDPYFQRQGELNRVFNPSDPSLQSRLEQSASQSLPKHGPLGAEQTFTWQAVPAEGESFFLRQISEATIRYDEDQGIATVKPYLKVKTFENFDDFNYPNRIVEKVNPLDTPLGVSLPEIITETELVYDETRSQLGDKNILNLPDYLIVKRNGEWLDFKRFAYDARGLKTQETSYVQSHLQTTVPEFEGRQTSYERTVSFEYDAFGNQVRASDSVGPIEEIVYDNLGIFAVKRRVPKANPAADDLVWNFFYKKGQLDHFQTPLGLDTSFSYDTLGRRTRMTSIGGAEETYSYKMGLNGNPSFIKVDIRRYADNAPRDAGETAKIARLEAYRPDGTRIGTMENASRGVDGLEKGVRVVAYEAYDRMKRKIFVWTPYTLYGPNQSVENTFQTQDAFPTPAAAGSPMTSNDPRQAGQVGVGTWYDFQGRVRQMKFPSGLLQRMAYATWGSIGDETYQRNGQEIHTRIRKAEHDQGVYAISEEDAKTGAAHVTRFERDALGNLSRITLPGETQGRTLVYDNRGFMEYQIVPGLGSYAYAYDERDRLVATVRISEDGRIRQKVEQTFDSQDRLTAQYLDGELAVSNTYDLYPSTMTPNPAYNMIIAKPLGLLAATKSFDTSNRLYDYEQRLAYDPFGRVVYRSVLMGGRNYEESYRYLLDGSMKNVKNPMNLEGNYVLDEAGKLRSVRIRLPNRAQEEMIIKGIAYTGKGQIEQILYRPINNTHAETNLVYNESTLQVKQIRTHYMEQGQPVWLQDLALSLDGNNNILSIDDNAKNGPFGHVDRTGRFDYNWKSELTQSTRYNKTLRYDYQPSGAFKLNEEMGPGSISPLAVSSMIPQGVAGQKYVFNGLGQLIQSPTIQNARYNAIGQLVFVETAAYQSYFGYNPEGERIYKRVLKKATNTQSESFYPMKSIAMEPGSPQSFIFIGDSRLVRLEENTGEWYYYLRDHLSSSDIMMHSSGKPVEQMLYHPYGTEEDPAKLSPAWDTHEKNLGAIKPKEKTHNRFTGHYLDDDSGLYYMNARYYDAKLGRFIQPDPYFLGKPVECTRNQLECNLYVYAKNNPLAYVDPTGLWSKGVHEQIIDKAFPKLPDSVRKQIKAGSEKVDALLDQFDKGTAPRHSMLEPGMTQAQGEKIRDAFMTDRANKARDLFARSNAIRQSSVATKADLKIADKLENQAWRAVGEMLHPVMDSTSPAHQDGSGRNEGWGVWKFDSHMKDHGPGPLSKESKINQPQMDETQRRMQGAMQLYLPEVARGEQYKIMPKGMGGNP